MALSFLLVQDDAMKFINSWVLLPEEARNALIDEVGYVFCGNPRKHDDHEKDIADSEEGEFAVFAGANIEGKVSWKLKSGTLVGKVKFGFFGPTYQLTVYSTGGNHWCFIVRAKGMLATGCCDDFATEEKFPIDQAMYGAEWFAFLDHSN